MNECIRIRHHGNQQVHQYNNVAYGVTAKHEQAPKSAKKFESYYTFIKNLTLQIRDVYNPYTY